RGAVRRCGGGGGDVLGQGRSPAQGEGGGPASPRRETAAADVEHERSPDPPCPVQQELHRAMLFKGTDGGTSPHLLGESVHDFDAREIALVNRSVVRLAGERLLVDAPVGMPIEEAPVTALQL